MPNRGGFSWNRLLGISAAKSRISRRTGIPLTRSGRQRKLGRMITGGGCLLPLAIVFALALLLVGCAAASPSGAPATVIVRETVNVPQPQTVIVPQTVVVPQTVIVHATVLSVVTATAEPPTQPTPPAQLGATAQNYGYTLTAVTIADPGQPASYYQAKPGTRLIAVEIILANETGEQQSSNLLHGVLIDAEGFTYAADTGLIADPIDLIELRQGNKIRGWIGFEVPLTAQPARLRWNVNGGFGDQFLEVGLSK